LLSHENEEVEIYPTPAYVQLNGVSVQASQDAASSHLTEYEAPFLDNAYSICWPVQAESGDHVPVICAKVSQTPSPHVPVVTPTVAAVRS
jgi:hypothetical protein